MKSSRRARRGDLGAVRRPDEPRCPASVRGPGRERRHRAARILTATLWVAALAGCAGEYPQTTFDPVTDFGAISNTVLEHAFWWMMGILVLVEVLLVYVIVRFRERPGREPPRQVYGHGALEVVWTLIPAVIVTAIAIPTVRAIFDVNRPAPADALVVDVIGHQWWWEFRYPELGVVTANELRLPVGRPIHLRLSSADVIHSFWVPQIGGKRDTNPITVAARESGEGVNHLTFTIFEPGRYSGQCAEYCGTSHALMRMLVVAQTPEEFEAWLGRMKTPATPSPGSLAERGREIFMRSACMACHSIAGTNARGVLGPNLTNLGERWAIGAGMLENTPENLARWIRDPRGVKPGAMMPGTEAGPGDLPPTGLSDAEVRAVVAYLESLGGPREIRGADARSLSSRRD